MRIVAADSSAPAKWRPGAGFHSRAGQVERAALVVTSLVLLLGLWLTYAEQTSGFAAVPAAAERGTIVNLATVKNVRDLAAVLQPFDGRERTLVAEAILRRIAAPNAPRLEHVGALSGLNVSGASRTASGSLRISAADVSAIKPPLIVRSPQEYRTRIAWAVALFFIAFWSAHLLRAGLGTIGDPVLLPAAHLLTGLGLMAMVAIRDPLRDMVIATTVSGGIAGGCALWVAISIIDFENPRLRRAVLAPLSAALGLAFVLLLFGDGPTGSGAKVNLLGGQPVEAIRLLVVFSIAAYFARRWQFLREFSETATPSTGLWRYVRLPRWKDVRPLAISIGALLLFFFLQKDLGPALVITCVFLGLYGIARARSALVIGGFATLVAGVVAGYAVGIPATVTRRVTMWLDPWENAMPRGDQISHALWALSSGGLWGLGPGVGDPELIPAGHTDLILAAIGEELGLVGVLAVAALFVLLVWRMLRIAVRAPGDYTMFLSAGLTLAVAAQALVIVGGILGLLPLAGVVTPFLSYGRSSMLSNFAALGICAAIARRTGAPRDTFVRPVRALGGTLAACAGVIVVTAVVIQGVRADEIAARPNLTQQADGGYRYLYNPRLTAASRLVVRGTIFDRNGVPLATSRPDEIDAAAGALKRLSLPVPDDCRREGARCYPLGGLAFHVLGDAVRQTNWAARNTSFAEKDFDSTLKGFDDRARTVEVRHPSTGNASYAVKRDYSELLPLVRHKGNPSHRDVQRLLRRDRDLHTTLDARLQVLAARAVRSRAEAARSDAAAAVVIDPASGALLASVSYPWPEPSDFAADTIDEARLLDRARYGLYAPGSTFKLVTAAAALRSDPEDLQSTFMCVRLPDGRVGGHVHGVARPVRDDAMDHVPHGRVDLRRGLVLSCNAYFAQLAQRVGAEALDETAAAAQIAATPARNLENLRRTLPHAGYGQGDVLASPLRMARVSAAIASDGVLRDVRVAASDDKTVAPAGASGSRPASRRGETPWLAPAAAAQLRGFMREAVTSGTGRVLAGHRVAIAGKTGTAEVDHAASHSWFTGFAPYGQARQRIAFAVIVEHAGYGARVAAPIAGDIVAAAQKLELIR